ncbi:baeRF7 domain-containing protein [Salinimicrobium flavum]|uniref:Uncharacterized protein n=1 Tax=Salinimicrobium flavum TaxID=1737065 RepID=A0ABW5J088_9FLAO
MPILTKEKFEKLAKFTNKPCVSIFLPTQRLGKDVLEEKDRIQLKSQWKKTNEKLRETGLSQEKIDKMGKPLEDLLGDGDFWRHQSDGLAIFMADGFFEKLTIPVNFESFTYIGEHFYLKPLIPMFSRDNRFYLLSLQLDNVQLFEGNMYSIGEIDIKDLIPERLEDRVGYDYEEKTLQFKSQNPSIGDTTMHGQGAAERDRKNEFLRFFRAVDKGLHEVLKEEKVPLIVACQDYLFPIYQEANTYKNLYTKPVPGNPSDYENILALHAAALDVLAPQFDKEKQDKMNQFRDMNPARTSTSVTEIIPAIFEGKVDTLFLQNREDIWGKYNEDMASVDLQDEPNSDNISLMNLAAVKVIEQGGTVYLIEKEFMPEQDSKMNAVYRY